MTLPLSSVAPQPPVATPAARPSHQGLQSSPAMALLCSGPPSLKPKAGLCTLPLPACLIKNVKMIDVNPQDWTGRGLRIRTRATQNLVHFRAPPNQLPPNSQTDLYKNKSRHVTSLCRAPPRLSCAPGQSVQSCHGLQVLVQWPRLPFCLISCRLLFARDALSHGFLLGHDAPFGFLP